jgi:hypothetical protein
MQETKCADGFNQWNGVAIASRVSTSFPARPLWPRVTHAEIVGEERKGKAPSDHAPVLVELR